MEVPGPYRCLLLFPRASSTGTVSCLYPLNHPSLLSFPSLGAGVELIYCTCWMWNLNSLFIGCIVLCDGFNMNRDVLQSCDWLDHARFLSWTSSFELTSWLMKKNGFHFCFEAPFVWTHRGVSIFWQIVIVYPATVCLGSLLCSIITLLMLPKAHIPIFH